MWTAKRVRLGAGRDAAAEQGTRASFAVPPAALRIQDAQNCLQMSFLFHAK